MMEAHSSTAHEVTPSDIQIRLVSLGKQKKKLTLMNFQVTKLYITRNSRESWAWE